MLNTMKALFSKFVHVAMAACVLLLTAGEAAAQVAPPQPPLTRTSAVWIGYMVMLLLGMLVLGISLYPSKRSHQD